MAAPEDVYRSTSCSAPHGARLPQCPRMSAVRKDLHFRFTPRRIRSMLVADRQALHSAVLRSGSGTDGRLANWPVPLAPRKHGGHTRSRI